MFFVVVCTLSALTTGPPPLFNENNIRDGDIYILYTVKLKWTLRRINQLSEAPNVAEGESQFVSGTKSVGAARLV